MEEKILAYDRDIILELKNISLTIGKRQILNGVNLEVKRGHILMVLGKSGSGKSTLLNIMNMLCVPDSGQYSIEGELVDFHDEEFIAKKRENIGFFHQELAILEGMTIKENMDIFSKVCKKPIDQVVLERYLKLMELENLYEENVSLLSGGERQRAAFLKLLIFPYEIIFIDEPTNNLDVENIQVIINGIKQLKEQCKTVVVVSHYTPFQEIADEVIRLEEINE